MNINIYNSYIYVDQNNACNYLFIFSAVLIEDKQYRKVLDKSLYTRSSLFLLLVHYKFS